MTREELLRLRALAEETSRKVEAIRDGLATAIDAPEPPSEAPAPLPRAVVTIGTASAKAGQQAAVDVFLSCPEPIAGIWLNIRCSPRLTFLNARSLVKARGFRVEPGSNEFRAVLMFSTDLETGSAAPEGGLVQIDPETPILRANFTAPADGTPGQQFVVQAGLSGTGAPGGPHVALRTLLLNWGQGIYGGGGFEPVVVDGYVEMIA